MNKRQLRRKYGLVLSAVLVPLLLLATLLLAGAARSAGGHQDVDPQDGQTPIRSSQRSVFSQRAGLPTAAAPTAFARTSPEPARQVSPLTGSDSELIDEQIGWIDNRQTTTKPSHTTWTGLTDTLKGPRFWDAPLRSGAIAYFNDRQVVTPGPDDQVRLIVQLHDDPVAVYIKRGFGAPGRRAVLDSKTLQNYADSLAASRRRVMAQIKQQGIQAKVNHEFSYLFNGFALSTKMRNWQRLQQLPQVKAVYPDYEVQAVLNDSVPLIGAPQVWQVQDANGDAVTGRGIRVAVIDTGVDYTHPDLGGCLGSPCKVIGGYDFVNDDNDPMDDNGHGTHVAGIVAASGTVTGVAPGASLLAYKALDAGGSGQTSGIIAALERASDPDGDPTTFDAVDVINMSLGGFGSPDDPLSQAVDNAVNQGIVVAVAAGNDGPDYQTLGSPGVARKALTVAASDKNDQLASFSSRGPIPDFLEVLKPDITAPGVSISSTVPISGELGSPDRYASYGGTSMATPHIAGAAALVKQLHPDWTPEMIKANLMNTARDLGTGIYEQGAGRVQLAEAVTTPLVAVPGSLSFGLPLFDGTTSAQLALVNVSTTTVTATASISTALWDGGALRPLTTTVPVTYAQLSGYDFTLSPGETSVITVTLDIPNNAPEGYYTGKVTLQSPNYALTVPFAFAILSKVTVHILDESGTEWFDTWDNYVYVVRVPETDVRRDNWFAGQVPATLYIPSGTYNVHGYGRPGVYHHLFWEFETQQRPLVLATTATITRNAVLDVYLNAATARHYTLDATTFAGDPLFVGKYRAGFRYQNGDGKYTTGMGGSYEGFKDSDLLAPLPTGLDFYISDTPDHISFTFASAGYAYSPRYLHFREINSARWYEGPDHEPGFDLRQWADEVYLFGWRYPKLDASTPTTFTYTQEQTGQYHLKYDFPGTMDNPWLNWGDNFATGGDALFYMPTDSRASVRPLSAGLERNVYVKGAFAYRYWADHLDNDRITEREFYTRDWTKAYTLTQHTNLQMIGGWDLQPLAPTDVSISFGAGPLYPAVIFDNVTSMIRLIHPVFGSSRGNKVFWGNSPRLTVYRDGDQVYYAELDESWWSPSPLRQIPASDEGAYRLLLISNHNAQISYNNTIQAGFTLPAADMNPPRVTTFEMPQRFAPGQAITATLTVTDAESGVSSVEMRYSTDEGISWTPLSLTHEGTHYATVINPGSALTLTLAYTVTDSAENYLAFTTLGAAIRETPVTLDLEISPVEIPLSLAPVTVHISGTLRKEGNEPLSEAALPIAIYLNDQFAGYVRDVARLADGTFQHGTIDFDWSFIPTDFVSSTGPAELKFVFDMGTYARQEKVFTVEMLPRPVQLSPTNGSVVPAGDVTFAWAPAVGATSYQIQIDTTAAFNSPALISDTVASTSYTAALTLGTWYWRVRALPDDGEWTTAWEVRAVGPVVQVTMNARDDSSPAIIQDTAGTLWVAWESYRSGNADIWYKTSTDGGVTWSAATQLTTDTSGDYEPAIVQAADGTLGVVWYSDRSGNADIWYKTSTDGGATWSAATQLPTDTSDDYAPAIVQAADDTLWVVWHSFRSGNADIWHKTSTDGGATWSAATQLTTDTDSDADPTIAQAADGSLWIVWERYSRLWYRTSSDGGVTWSAEAQIDDSCCYVQPGLVVTGDGVMWLASWHNGDIGYQTSSDNGVTWSAPQQWPRFVGDDDYPNLAVLSSNRVGLVWQSNRSGNYDIWFGIFGEKEDVNPPPYVRGIEHIPSHNPVIGDIITIRGWAQDETGLSDVELLWGLNGAGQANLTMYDDGAHNDGEVGDGEYGVQLEPLSVGSSVTYTVQAADVDGNRYRYPWTRSFQVLEPFVKTADILFVPDYGGNNTDWFRPYFTDALDELGYSYDVWDTGLRGKVYSDTLNLYTDGVVIWSVPYRGYLGDSDVRPDIEAYLDGGGKLFITGQNIAEFLDGTMLLSDCLHATYVQNDTDLYALNGASGDPIGDGLMLAISGGDGANNQFDTDEIDPISPAVTVFTYDTVATTALAEPVRPEAIGPGRESGEPGAVPTPAPGSEPESSRQGPAQVSPSGVISSGTGGLRVDTGTYKVVFFTFGFEGINNQVDRNAVMERVLAWLRGVPPPGTPGDANSDGTVDAGDISALVLEIFDGDGNTPADAPGGSFSGDPVGCDANEDGVVDAGDISCTVLLIFNGPGACGGTATRGQGNKGAREKGNKGKGEKGGRETGSLSPPHPVTPSPPHPVTPSLSVPERVPASPGEEVAVPIRFAGSGREISSLVFAVDYDERWLSFDPADGDGDGVPDAVTFKVPAGFNASVVFDRDDAGGELDIFIADTFPPLGALPDGELATVRLQVVGEPAGTVEAAVGFSQAPPASFGDTAGRRVPGVTAGGSVLIGRADRETAHSFNP